MRECERRHTAGGTRSAALLTRDVTHLHLSSVIVSSSDDSSCCALPDTRTAAAAGECLIQCGFAILRGAYAASLLELARDAFEPWFCCERDELRRFLSFSGTGGLRGRGRTHVALPGVLFDANATDQLLFNREVATALVAALPDAMLAFASLIHSAVGASEQATHVDARRDDGVKLRAARRSAQRGPLVLEPQRAASAARRWSPRRASATPCSTATASAPRDGERRRGEPHGPRLFLLSRRRRRPQRLHARLSA